VEEKELSLEERKEKIKELIKLREIIRNLDRQLTEELSDENPTEFDKISEESRRLTEEYEKQAAILDVSQSVYGTIPEEFEDQQIEQKEEIEEQVSVPINKVEPQPETKPQPQPVQEEQMSVPISGSSIPISQIVGEPVKVEQESVPIYGPSIPISQIVGEPVKEEQKEETKLSSEEIKNSLKELKLLQKLISELNYLLTDDLAVEDISKFDDHKTEREGYENKYKELAKSIGINEDPSADLKEYFEEQQLDWEEDGNQIEEEIVKDAPEEKDPDQIADTKDFVAQLNEGAHGEEEKIDLVGRVRTNIEKSIRELEKAKTIVNSDEYKNLISFMRKLKEQNALNSNNLKTNLTEIGQMIDSYINHKARDGVKTNTYNKLAAVQKANVWLSQAMKEREMDRAMNYQEVYEREGGAQKKLVPKPEEVLTLTGKENSNDKDNSKYVDNCICTIILRAKEDKRTDLNNVRKELNKGVLPVANAKENEKTSERSL